MITIRSVTTPREFDRFIAVPWEIFADDPNWVPPLKFERREFLNPKKNPYFEHAKTAFFIAERNGRDVGRISAQICEIYLQRYQNQTGHFGFIDAVDDAEVFAALFAAAEGWLQENGMTHALGPFSLSINEETGTLVEGFDRPPMVMMGHALPFYNARIIEQGYGKAKDVLCYDYDLKSEMPRRMRAIIKKLMKNGTISVRPLRMKHLARDVDMILDIFNDAWSDNWSFVPMTDKEISALANTLKMLVKERAVAIAFDRGEPAAMAVSLPNVNELIRDLDGRLLPFGWLKLLWRLKIKNPKSMRVVLMGVRKKYHATPMAATLSMAVVERLQHYHRLIGTERAEFSWILEDNMPMRNMIESAGGRHSKTYRLYKKDL